MARRSRPQSASSAVTTAVFDAWFALLLPRGAEPGLVAPLNTLANEVIADPVATGRLNAAGLDVLGGTPKRLAQHLREEIARHAVLVRASGAQID